MDAPPAWERLSDEDLVALLRQAQPPRLGLGEREIPHATDDGAAA